jgi:hypothetical protein
VGIATDYGLDCRSPIPGKGQEIFLYFSVSRLPLGPAQLPAQRVPGALSLGIKQSGRKTDHSPPSSADVKNGGAIPLLLHTSSWRDA